MVITQSCVLNIKLDLHVTEAKKDKEKIVGAIEKLLLQGKITPDRGLKYYEIIPNMFSSKQAVDLFLKQDENKQVKMIESMDARKTAENEREMRPQNR